MQESLAHSAIGMPVFNPLVPKLFHDLPSKTRP